MCVGAPFSTLWNLPAELSCGTTGLLAEATLFRYRAMLLAGPLSSQRVIQLQAIWLWNMAGSHPSG